MKQIPTENAFSAAIGLFSDGFEFIVKRREKHQSDIFKINLLLLKVICFEGEDAARTFYDPAKFKRKGAVPPPVQKTLTGKNAIHTTDGELHHNRKEMFMSLMTEENITWLTKIVENELYHAIDNWQQKDSIVLFEESSRVLTKAICTWAGVPIRDEEVPLRAQDFIGMIDAFGSIGGRNFRGRRARKRTEKWLIGIISDVRAGRLGVEEGTALFATVNHRNPDGSLFEPRMAAIELMNILRPTVAIAYYITFGATALNTYPELRQKFKENKDNYRDLLINEIRRYYPFAPFMGALVKETFEWNGYKFPKNALVLLDMYGTNHDPGIWEEPSKFNPDRFLTHPIKPFDFLAQGGGDPHNGHRCPGEWITIEVLKTFLGFMVERLRFTAPAQDLSYDLSRMPIYPKSGFRMKKISRL